MNSKQFDTEALVQTFRKHFGTEPLLVRSPGRVNIIGEHTDYNEGFVLPAAIDKAAYVAISPRNDEEVHLYASAFSKNFRTTLSSIKPVNEHWPNYILGVADQLIKRGYPIKGFNLVIDADVPSGSGLSSSAAVECATAFGLNEIFQLNIPRKELALISQKAEHVFAGVMCGIMDQFASVFGKKDHVIKLDCKTLEYEYVPFKLEGYKILLLNSNVKHSLASSEYNVRRAQCEQGVALIKQHHPAISSLRDVDMAMLDQFVKPVDELVYRRCRYVVEEIQRLLEGCEDLKEGRLDRLGEKMYRTHDGLSQDYEVSCPELDFLVDAVRGNPDVPGARMMGGGFGGCTINIVREEAIEKLVKDISVKYQKAMHKDLTPYIASIEDGTGVVK